MSANRPVQPPAMKPEYQALYHAPDLHERIYVRLLEIGFTEGGASAIRALEIVLGLPQEANDDLAGVATAALVAARERARAFIQENAGVAE